MEYGAAIPWTMSYQEQGAPIAEYVHHCPHCGSTSINKKTNGIQCSDCDKELYFNVAAGAVSVILNNEDGQLLVTVRGNSPGKGMLDLPGGFVDPGESIEQAASREIQEELGVDIFDIQYFTSAPNTYVYKGVAYAVLDITLTATLQELPEKGMDDVAAIKWMDIADLNPDDFAFTSIQAAIRLLQESA